MNTISKEELRLFNSKLKKNSRAVASAKVRPSSKINRGFFGKSKEVNKNISRAVKSRPLSPMQQAYRDYFRSKLGKYGVNSPAQLSNADKKAMFDEVRDDWPKEKAKVQKMLKDMSPMDGRTDIAATAFSSKSSDGLSFKFNYHPDYVVKSSSFVTFATFVSRDYISTSKSDAQQAYQNFFKSMLEKYGVSSPADMDNATASEFFLDIKTEWPAHKAELGL